MRSTIASMLTAALVLAPVSCSPPDAPLSARVQELERRVAALESAAAAATAVAAPAASATMGAGEQSACAAAKVTARIQWEATMAPVDAEIAAGRVAYASSPGCCSQADSTYPCGRGSVGCAISDRISALKAFSIRIKAARDACSSGAFALRDAAVAVNRPKGTNTDVATAQRASEAAFQACKDEDP